MDNLIAAGKIKPFAIVMGNGMVKQRIDGELKLNRALYGQMLVEEILIGLLLNLDKHFLLLVNLQY